MAWVKDLGRVKGDNGDIYIPSVNIEDGQMVFSWNKASYDNEHEYLLTSQPIKIPIYVPELINGETLIFKLSTPVKNIDGTNFPNEIIAGNIKGDQGPEGNVKINLYHVPEDREITDPTIPRETDTIYIQNSKAWIYDETLSDAENPFVLIEGMDLSGYALKNDVYTKAQINTMFENVTSQLQLLALLYDIDQ